MQFLIINSNPPRKSTSIQKKYQNDPLSRSKIKNLVFLKKSKFFDNMIFRFWREFQEFLKNFRDFQKKSKKLTSQLCRILIFDLLNGSYFFESKWIFEADSNLLSEIASEFTGEMIIGLCFLWHLRQRCVDFVFTVALRFGKKSRSRLKC